MRQFSKWRFFRGAKPVLLFVGGWLGRVFSARWVAAARVLRKGARLWSARAIREQGVAKSAEVGGVGDWLSVGCWVKWCMVIGCACGVRSWVVRKNISLSWESPVGLHGCRAGIGVPAGCCRGGSEGVLERDVMVEPGPSWQQGAKVMQRTHS